MSQLSEAQIADQLASASVLLEDKQYDEAGQVLFALTEAAPKVSEAHRMLGVVCRLLGDPVNAEYSLRAALAADKKAPANHNELASLMAATDRPKEAERSFRAALALNRRYERAALGLARLLLSQDRAAEAVQVTTPLAVTRDASAALLFVHARGLQDVARHEEAELAIRTSLSKGQSTAEGWLLLAHTLQDQGEYDAAEEAYREVLARQGDHLQAHNDLAELIWMRTGDRSLALKALDAAQAFEPDQWAFGLARSRALAYAGEPREALDALLEALTKAPQEPLLLAAAARASWQAGETQRAVAWAEQALAGAPDDAAMKLVLAQACLAAADPDRASLLAGSVVEGSPFDQLALAVQSTAWRILGDDRYPALYDYDRLVQSADVEPPQRWTSLAAYLTDLREALVGLHGLKTHPFGQSVRGGSQVALRGSRDPAIAALPDALAPAIRAILGKIGKGEGPVRSRNNGKWRFTGLWSVRLASAGFHENHVHPGGWLSSACHIDLPELSDGDDKAGYLSFGEPGVPTQIHLPAERYVKPQPGRLVLFPSYMWHGTVPFVSETPRLSVAFDLVPG